MKDKKQDLFLRLRQVGVLTTIPMLLVGGPLLGYVAGRWLDQKFGFDPYGKVTLMVLGFLGAAREVFRMIQEVSKES